MEYAIPAAIHPIFVHFAIALTLFGVGLVTSGLLLGVADFSTGKHLASVSIEE